MHSLGFGTSGPSRVQGVRRGLTPKSARQSRAYSLRQANGLSPSLLGTYAVSTNTFRPSLESLDARFVPSVVTVMPPTTTGMAAQSLTAADASRPTAAVGELSISKMLYFPRNSNYQIQLVVSARPPLARSLPVNVTFYWSDSADGRCRIAVASVEPGRRSEGKETLIYNKKLSDFSPRP